MITLKQHVERLEKLEGKRGKVDVVLPYLERALASADVCIQSISQEPEFAEYYARLEEWFQSDMDRLIPFQKALTFVLASNQAEYDIRRRIAAAFGIDLE